jgi:hypothetical protein
MPFMLTNASLPEPVRPSQHRQRRRRRGEASYRLDGTESGTDTARGPQGGNHRYSVRRDQTAERPADARGADLDMRQRERWKVDFVQMVSNHLPP